MNRIHAMFLSVVALALKASGAPADDSLHPVTDAYDGWRLCVQAWTFNHFTFSEAVEKEPGQGPRGVQKGEPVIYGMAFIGSLKRRNGDS